MKTLNDDEALIWLPGLVCDEAVWTDVRAHFSQPGEVITYPQSRSIAAMAQRVLTAAAGRRVWLVGHSMGGRVAIEVARQLDAGHPSATPPSPASSRTVSCRSSRKPGTCCRWSSPLPW